MADNIIELRKINRFFGSGGNRIHVLRDIDLDIARGDFVAILGQSGSGKSTLMNTLGCLDKPTSGSYKIDGVETARLDDNQLARLRSAKLGFIFQRYNLLGSVNARDNVALPAVYSGLSREARDRRALELLNDLGLPDKPANFPNQLSGGQQQRVSIARALMNGGEIILADEPTGALDSASGDMVMEILGDLHRRGHTIILVTHDRHVAGYAHREVEIKDGVIISDQRTKNAGAAVRYRPAAPPKRNVLLLRKDQFVESFRMSAQAIVAHKMRSLLTMLGIIIGIASVVSMVALGQGTQQQILSNISSLGTDTIDIYPGARMGDRRSGRVKTLTVADSEVLGQQPYIASSTPNASTSGVVVRGNVEATAQLQGVGEAYFDVKGLSLEKGRFFGADEVRENASVAVIDSNTVKTLFPDGGDPLGAVILFRKQPLEVIGVTKPQQMMFGPSDQLMLWSPYTAVMHKITGDRYISSITVKIASDVVTQVAEKNLTDLLTVRHGGVKDFNTRNSDSLKQSMERTTMQMAIFISGIAVISLIVGGIGVMNIMLVSVTERTREIGIRMAIGARQSNILEQFLIEAVLICVIGGATGVLLSYGIGYVVNNFLSASLGGLSMAFSTLSIVLALGCSSGIGILFGYLPARNASRLDPIEALSRD